MSSYDWPPQLRVTYTTDTTASNLIAWTAWTTTATSSSTQVWTAWQWPNQAEWNQPAPLTEEQLAAQRERHRLQVEQDRVAQEARREARERARALLLEGLNAKQRTELDKDGYFHVETRRGQRRYRLSPHRAPLRVHGEDGLSWSYCIHPISGGWPPDDVVLAVKLLLETDEDEFLRIANASRSAVSA